jgi:hypothetical protein
LYVALTTTRRIIISVDGIHFRCYNTIRFFGSFVTAVEFQSGVLLFGTDQGSVYAFTARKPLNFLRLDLSKPAW